MTRAPRDADGAAPGRVLVVHDDEGRRRPVAGAIADLGFEVVEVSTPVEAIWELENGPMDFHAAVVARGMTHGDGQDIVQFISLRYPGITQVLLGDEVEPGAIDRALVDAVLGEPLAAATAPTRRD